MSDFLDIIQKVIEAHQLIRGQIQTVGQVSNDLGALFSLRSALSGWTVSSTEAFAARHKSLQGTVTTLQAGLLNHFDFEGRYLPPLLGEVLMTALQQEHGDIMRMVPKVQALVGGVRIEGAGREQLLGQRTQIAHQVADLCQMIEEHAAREEVILNMLKHSLERK